jgi:hypothetical protein
MTRVGTAYSLVLTHDIDVLSVVDLPIGRTLAGFFYRCLAENLLRLLRGGISPAQYYRSLHAAAECLPAKLGYGLDVWARSLGAMLSRERALGVRSTLFFIPLYGEAGVRPENGEPAPGNRAAFYRLGDHCEVLQQLVGDGWEVGVHGINAWRSVEDACRELHALKAVCPQQERVGIRMHWLYQRAGMWKHLDEAGFSYDSTLGWNGRIGFPGGKYTPFKPDGSKNLVVLPLNIQDGALLERAYLNLRPEQAWQAISEVLDVARAKHAVVTVLWHNNSFVAPRFWGDLYERVIRQASTDGAEILTAGQAVARHSDMREG